MDKKPNDKFSESYQFIQELFQQPETARQRWRARLVRASRLLRASALLLLLATLVALIVLFRIEALEINSTGVWLPRR